MTPAVFEHIRSGAGIFFLLFLAWLLSNNKKKIDLRIVLWGVGLQFIFALIIHKTIFGKEFFLLAENGFEKLLSFSEAGARFIFGDLMLGIPPADGANFQLIDTSTGHGRDFVQIMGTYGPRFAFRVLPSIIFFASLISVLYHLGVMQRVVAAFAWVMAKTMGTSGGETLSAACNIFVGQSEAPILVRPYIGKMTMSELMAVMVSGFATISGAVMAAYITFGMSAGHLISASVMSAPGALVMAKIIFPEAAESLTKGTVKLKVEKDTVNVLDAAAKGASTGLLLAANVAAMLITFIALIALVNYLLSFAGLGLNQILGWIFSPVAFFMGVPMQDVLSVGRILGTQMSVNEFVAYLDLGAMKNTLSERAFVITTYSICGFANFSSIAIQIGGIGALAPERKSDLAKLGLKAMLGGALASWMTGTIAGLLLK